MASGTDKKSVEEMLGEVLRDIGVLIVVFFPFDEWLTFHRLTRFSVWAVVFSAISIACGVVIEVWRK